MQPARTFVVVLATVLLQVALGSILEAPLFVPFDVFLILVVFYAAQTNPLLGTLLGALLGLCDDALSTHKITGRFSFSFALTGYCVGKLNSLFVVTAGLMKMLTVFVATWVSSATVYLLDLVIEGGATLRPREVLRAAIVNALISPVVMALLARWHHTSDRRELDRGRFS